MTARTRAQASDGRIECAMRSIEADVLPDYDANEVHHGGLPARPQRAVRVTLALPLASDPGVRRLPRLREARDDRD